MNGAPLDRRTLLRGAGLGLGALALADVLGAQAGPFARAPHHSPRAKRVIYLFQSGGRRSGCPSRGT